MNQVLIFAEDGNATRYFFVRKFRKEHSNVESAHNHAMTYRQSKFDELKKQHPNIRVIDSIEHSHSKEVLGFLYESLGYVSLNVRQMT